MKMKKTAIVTGAGQGIGRGISLELAKNGFDIVGVDIRYDPDNTQKGLFEVKQHVEELDQAFLPVHADVSSLEVHENILGQTLDRFEKVDVLINNAGVAPETRRDVLETTPESYDRVMSVNSRGAFFLTQKTARQMIKQVKKDPAHKPAVVFISSVSADFSSPSRAEYCISKAALSQTARVFADRLADFGISVFEIRPGIIKTEMTAPNKKKYDKLIGEGFVPQKRWGFPEDVAKAVASLVRGDFAYSTGLIVEVSGGMNIRRL
jgi:NAD(P)-dependent dehydrogenase (short-subunit alcohol dehydrogenase family)